MNGATSSFVERFGSRKQPISPGTRWLQQCGQRRRQAVRDTKFPRSNQGFQRRPDSDEGAARGVRPNGSIERLKGPAKRRIIHQFRPWSERFPHPEQMLLRDGLGGSGNRTELAGQRLNGPDRRLKGALRHNRERCIRDDRQPQRCSGRQPQERERPPQGICCSSLCSVGTSRYLTGLFRRRIAWDDGTIREGSGAGEVAFAKNRCC